MLLTGMRVAEHRLETAALAVMRSREHEALLQQGSARCLAPEISLRSVDPAGTEGQEMQGPAQHIQPLGIKTPADAVATIEGSLQQLLNPCLTKLTQAKPA